MNWDAIEGNWQQVKGKVKQHWGELTDDQLDLISGKRDAGVTGAIRDNGSLLKIMSIYDTWFILSEKYTLLVDKIEKNQTCIRFNCDVFCTLWTYKIQEN